MAVVLGGRLFMKLAAGTQRSASGEHLSNAHHARFYTSSLCLKRCRKRGQEVMVICADARKGGNTGSHWSKPAAPPLHSTS